MINHKYPSSSFNGNHGNQWRAGNQFPIDKERQLPAIITPVMGTHLAERKPVFTLKRRPLSQVANTTILFVKTVSHTSNNVNASHEGENTRKQIKKANPH